MPFTPLRFQSALAVGGVAQMSIEFVRWAREPGGRRAFLSDPAFNTDIFFPMLALGMTVNVVLGPVAFFLPEFSEQVPIWAAFGIYPYALLLLALVAVSLVVVKMGLIKLVKPVKA